MPWQLKQGLLYSAALSGIRKQHIKPSSSLIKLDCELTAGWPCQQIEWLVVPIDWMCVPIDFNG